MTALKLDMTIPLGTAGHVRLTIDVADIDALTGAQRQVLADTGRDFCEFAAATLAPSVLAGGTPFEPSSGPAEATVYDPNLDVLNGVTGSRKNTS